MPWSRGLLDLCNSTHYGTAQDDSGAKHDKIKAFVDLSNPHDLTKSMRRDSSLDFLAIDGWDQGFDSKILDASAEQYEYWNMQWLHNTASTPSSGHESFVNSSNVQHPGFLSLRDVQLNRSFESAPFQASSYQEHLAPSARASVAASCATNQSLNGVSSDGQGRLKHDLDAKNSG